MRKTQVTGTFGTPGLQSTSQYGAATAKAQRATGVSAGHVSVWAQNESNRRIDNIVQKHVNAKLRQFKKKLDKASAAWRKVHRRFARKWEEVVALWDAEGDRLLQGLEEARTLTTAVKSNIIMTVHRAVILPLERLKALRARIDRTAARLEEELIPLCTTLYDQLISAVPSINPYDVYQDFMDLPPFTVPFEPAPILPAAFEQSYNLAHEAQGGHTLFDLITSKVIDADRSVHELCYAQASTLLEECSKIGTSLPYRGAPLHTRHDAEGAVPSERLAHALRLRVADAVGALIARLSEADISASNQVMMQLYSLMRDVLGIEFQIEAAAPSTERDIMLARLLTTCDEDSPDAHEIIEIGINLGLDEAYLRELASVDIHQLCRVVQSQFEQ
jgi:hypothetical protein